MLGWGIEIKSGVCIKKKIGLKRDAGECWGQIRFRPGSGPEDESIN